MGLVVAAPFGPEAETELSDPGGSRRPGAIEDQEGAQVDGDVDPGGEQRDGVVDGEDFAERDAAPENLETGLFLVAALVPSPGLP